MPDPPLALLPPKVHSWENAKVLEWLDSIGMGKYRDTFKENNISGVLLPLLAMNEGEALLKLGVNPKDVSVLNDHILRIVFGYTGPTSLLRPAGSSPLAPKPQPQNQPPFPSPFPQPRARVILGRPS